MAVGLVQSAKNNYGSNVVLATDITVGAGQGWVAPTAGNLLVIVLGSQVSNVAPTYPAGFTERLGIGSSGVWYSDYNHVATKVAAGTETTFTVTLNTSSRYVAMMVFEIENANYGSAAGTSANLVSSLAFPSTTPSAGTEAFLLGGATWTDAYGPGADPTNYTLIDHEVGNSGTNSVRILSWYRSVPSASGSYTGTVACTNPVQIATWQMLFTASSPPPPGSPVANFSGTPRTGQATLAVTFTDLSTNTPTSWLWDFGDGGTSTSQNPVHNYTAPGSYTVSLTATNATGSDDEVKVAYIIVSGPAEPGVFVEWDDEFVELRVAEWVITRGASPELTGSSQPGSSTIRLINTSDDRYNPENTGGPYYGLLRDGPRVWIGVNEDGTVTQDDAKTVYGLFAGRITELSVLPEGGATVAPFVELVCADPFEWAGRQRVTLPDSRTRSQADLRSDVLDELAWTLSTLPTEPATLPLSSADGLALNILDELNAANGTRHFAKPEDNSATWFRYVAVRRTEGLDGSSSASIDAGSEHLTDTTGWRISADGVINQQKASVEPLWFSPLRDVWEYTSETPLTVVTGTPFETFVEFPDYVDAPVVDIAYTGSALTTDLVPFGHTAKLTLTSAGTSVVQILKIQGHIVVRGSIASFVKDDAVSQADSRGVRAGPDLTGDYLGTITSAEGFARHIVYRFGSPYYRPTITVINWFPEQFDLDLFDRISVTVAELSIADRLFEIVGLTHHGEMAAADVDGNPTAVLHTVTYVLQECREQTDPGWFILDDSLLDGTDILAF